MDCVGIYRLHRTYKPHFTEPEPRRPGIDAKTGCHDCHLLRCCVAPWMEQDPDTNRDPSGDDDIELDDGCEDV